MSNLDYLKKTKEEQSYIALSTTKPEILDVLANSDSALVKMSVLANPNVSKETAMRLIDDENHVIWQRATEVLETK